MCIRRKSGEALARLALGSAPADRTKMSGEHGFESAKQAPRSKGGGSMKGCGLKLETQIMHA